MGQLSQSLDFAVEHRLNQGVDGLDLAQALSTAIKASQKGRRVVMDYFGQLKKVQEKAQAGLVSEADVESEKAIGAELALGLPGVGILGEEDAFTRKDEKLLDSMWVVDPLDGTTNYVHGFPIFCISIGLQWKGELVAGVVDVPVLDKVYTCAKGQGAFVNGEPIRVSQRTSIKESLLATGFIPDNHAALKEQLRIFSDLVYEARGIRRAGAAAYDLCLAAEGVFDAFWEKNLKPWDAAAGALMVREAGGVAWTYSGGDYKLGNDSLLAGNPIVSALLRDRINR
jgi:myo-inositol-1(or 4)-monophosphatase